ncbi:MAG: four helix bundle protein [Nitrospiraceae bacterium]
MHSRGSLAETKNHLIYGQRVGHFKQTNCGPLIESTEEIWKELNALIKSLQKRTDRTVERI